MTDRNKALDDVSIKNFTEILYRRAEKLRDKQALNDYYSFLNLTEAEKIERIREAQAIEARQARETQRENARILDAIALDDAPDFPLDCLPDCLRGYVCAISSKYHINEAATAFCALTLAGSFAGYKFKLYFSDYGATYPKTGVVCVAPRGSGKSSLFKILSLPIREIVNADKTRYLNETETFRKKQVDLKQAQQELRSIDERLKRHRKDGVIKDDDRQRLKARVSELEATIETLEKELTATKEPTPPALYLVEPKTPEGNKRTILTNLTNGHRNGVIIATHEGVKLFSLAGGEKQAFDRFAQYTEILDGGDFDEITITTKGAGEFFLPGEKFAGILACIQPAPFRSILKNDVLRHQGFYNRFIQVYSPFPRDVAMIEPLETQAKKSYFRIFQFLAETDGATFELSREALETYQNWRVKNQERKNAANDCGDDDAATFAGKAEIYCLCFAQTLAICDYVDRLEAAPDNDDETTLETTIDAATMKRAISIIDCAIETTAACMRYLLSKRAPAPGYNQRLGQLETRLLDVIATAGANGATAQNIKDKINAFRGAKGTDADKKLKALLQKLRDAGEIIKRGEKYALVILNPTGAEDD